jgi:hypothetical protein
MAETVGHDSNVKLEPFTFSHWTYLDLAMERWTFADLA